MGEQVAKCYPPCQGHAHGQFFHPRPLQPRPSKPGLPLSAGTGVEVVVDTRSSPYSKYVPQFDKELMPALSGGGRRFATSFSARNWVAAPPIPTYYDASGRVLYSRLRDDARFQAAIARLESGMERFQRSPALRRGRPRPLPSPPAHRPRPHRTRPHHAPHPRRRPPGTRLHRCHRIRQAVGRRPARAFRGT